MAQAPPRARVAERELARFGPLTVTRASMTPLRIVLAIAALLNALLLGSLVALWLKMRRLESELASAVRDEER
jgi:hypothetical protein